MTKWPPPVYHLSVDFHAPLDYVFRWCTDYRVDDGKRAGENFVRRVLERNPRSIVLQDLYKEPHLWYLNHNRVTLFPPDRWHVDSFGTLRTLSIDYTLRKRSDGRTRLDMRFLRRPTQAFPGQPSRREYEAGLRTMWRNYARALHSDLRKDAKRARKSRAH